MFFPSDTIYNIGNVTFLYGERSKFGHWASTKTLIYLPNISSSGELLAEIFPSTTVKLDPFHAIQRTTREIPKKKGTTANAYGSARNAPFLESDH